MAGSTNFVNRIRQSCAATAPWGWCRRKFAAPISYDEYHTFRLHSFYFLCNDHAVRG